MSDKVNGQYNADYNLSQGYIKLFRSICGKSWWKKSEHVHLFIHLLLKASHSGFETWVAGKTVRLVPGQLVTGRKKLSDETGINESKIERILKTFENEQQIEQQTFNTSRLISIRNWTIYQNNEQQNEQQLNNGRTTDEQQLNTIQEGKERKIKNKRDKAEASSKESDDSGQLINPFSENFLPAWREYIQFRSDQHRFSYKNAGAQQKALDSLFQMAGGDEERAKKIIDQTIIHGWKGLFPIKSEGKGLHIDTGADKTPADFFNQWNNQSKTA